VTSLALLVSESVKLARYIGPVTQCQEAAPNDCQDEEPKDECPKVVLARFVFPSKCPNQNHDEANAGNGHDEQREHPPPDGCMFVVIRPGHSGKVLSPNMDFHPPKIQGSVLI
jgi:hypothetical protein